MKRLYPSLVLFAAVTTLTSACGSLVEGRPATVAVGDLGSVEDGSLAADESLDGPGAALLEGGDPTDVAVAPGGAGTEPGTATDSRTMTPDGPSAADPSDASGGDRAPASTGAAAGTGGDGGPPIELGYVIMDTAGADALLGSSIGERDQGAAKREMEALIAHANDTGGVGGRKIEGQGFVVPVTSRVQERVAKCVEMTEDAGVEVVIDVQIFIHEQSQACFAQRQTTLIAIVTGSDRRFLNQLRPYVATTWATLDRQAEMLADGLDAAGYFDGATLGVVHSDEPTVRRVYDDQLLPALEARGVEVEEVARMSTDPGAMQAQASNAVLRFQTAGITHVVMVTNVLQYLAFTNQAESQGYRPRYGIGDFQAGTGVAAFYGSPNQNANALGISVAHYLIPDTNERSSTDTTSPLDPATLTPGHRRCLDILSERTGRDYYDPGSAGSSGFEIFYCDHFFLWLDAARKVGSSISPQTFGDGLARLGGEALPSVANANQWGPGRADGASTYRVGKYDSSCRCFVGVTPWRPLAG